jgi:quercetin dioxygenase-like cupin family protein
MTGRTLVLAVGLTVAAMAAPPPPKYAPRITYVPRDVVDDVIANGANSRTKSNELIARDNDLGMRVSVGSKTATPPVTEAEVHSTFGHIFYIADGEGTLVLGGELINPREMSPGEFRGSGVSGGQEFQMKKGDMITIQVGMPHWWKQVPKGVTYVAYHSFPESRQGQTR